MMQPAAEVKTETAQIKTLEKIWNWRKKRLGKREGEGRQMWRMTRKKERKREMRKFEFKVLKKKKKKKVLSGLMKDWWWKSFISVKENRKQNWQLIFTTTKYWTSNSPVIYQTTGERVTCAVRNWGIKQLVFCDKMVSDVKLKLMKDFNCVKRLKKAENVKKKKKVKTCWIKAGTDLVTWWWCLWIMWPDQHSSLPVKRWKHQTCVKQ